MVLYDNTAVEIRDATDDSQLNVLFTTASLRGVNNMQVASCPNSYIMDRDVSNNIVCERTDTIALNPICASLTGGVAGQC
jgi:hypothetical protein